MELQVKKMLCPENRYAVKCPNTMNPEYITIHNTANDASAENEIKYMISNDKEVSYHFAVDDVQAVQGLPLNRNGWHAGDGNGDGNRKSIAIEICYSKSGGERFDKAEQNAAYLTAQLLKERGWGIDKVKKHQDWSGKYCPHRTLDLGWDRFLNMVQGYMNGAETVSVKKPYTAPKLEPINPNVDVSYQVGTEAGKIYSWVKNYEDFAGNPGERINGFRATVSQGSIKYRAHYLDGTWSDWCVDGAWCGDGRIFDAIEIYYITPDWLRNAIGKYKYAIYRVAPVGKNYYSEQIDNKVDKSKGLDGYAGSFGKGLDRLQLKIGDA